ncbi:hypothetical protein ANO11243_049620 [Dothideomycetidae sp. 11243]|nr:hypothetical protein ANO11243_049620 [fungal sp. No.11243]
MATDGFQIYNWHNFIYCFDQALLKTTFALFYLRVMPKKSWQSTVVTAMTAFYVAFMVVFAFVTSCGNPSDLTCDPGKHTLTAFIAQSIFNAVMDWLLTLLPITVIMTTLLPMRTKLSIVGVMLIGLAASAISIARITALSVTGRTGEALYHTFVKVILLSFWENCLSQIAIAVAALKPLLRIVFGVSDTVVTGHQSHPYSRSRTRTGKSTAVRDGDQIKCQTVVEVHHSDGGCGDAIELLHHPVGQEV